jgi:hypothetical protein
LSEAPAVVEGRWTAEARRLGTAAPFVVRLGSGPLPKWPDACAWCGAEKPQGVSTVSSAGNRPVKLSLPLCNACLPTVRRGQMIQIAIGAVLVAYLAPWAYYGYEHPGNLSPLSAAFENLKPAFIFLLLGLLALGGGILGFFWLRKKVGGKGMETTTTPALRLSREPLIVLQGAGFDLFVAAGFLVALREANPDLPRDAFRTADRLSG